MSKLLNAFTQRVEISCEVYIVMDFFLQWRPHILVFMVALFLHYDLTVWVFSLQVTVSRAVRNSKKSSWLVTGLWNRGPLKILSGIKLILDGQGNHLDSHKISLKSFKSFRGPLFRKPVTGQEPFFAVFYSKLALLCATYENSSAAKFSFKLDLNKKLMVLFINEEQSCLQVIRNIFSEFFPTHGAFW